MSERQSKFTTRCAKSQAPSGRVYLIATGNGVDEAPRAQGAAARKESATSRSRKTSDTLNAASTCHPTDTSTQTRARKIQKAHPHIRTHRIKYPEEEEEDEEEKEEEKPTRTKAEKFSHG